MELDSETEEEHEEDDFAEEHGVDLQQEIVPPMAFYPTTDLFTVLSILEGAFMAHCCCHIKEPATTAPTRRTRRASYEKPFHSLEKEFRVSDYVLYDEIASFHGDSLSPHKPGIWRRGEMKVVMWRLRKKNQVRKKMRGVDAVVALDLEWEGVEIRFDTGFYDKWEGARKRAGFAVPDCEY
jgi:hypothetical protein